MQPSNLKELMVRKLGFQKLGLNLEQIDAIELGFLLEILNHEWVNSNLEISWHLITNFSKSLSTTVN